MSRMALGVRVLAVVAAAAAQQRPSLSTSNSGGVTISVPTGQNVSMATYGPGGRTDTLVTGGYLNAVTANTLNMADNSAQQRIVNALASVRANISTLAAATTSNAAAVIAGDTSLATRFSAELSTLRLRVDAVTNATQALAQATPTTINCPARAPLASGTSTGHGTHPGAVYILTCNAGFALRGVPGGGNAVVCAATSATAAAWSDGNQASCVAATTTLPPTAAPTVVVAQTVSCCAIADNFLWEVYANGVQLPITRQIPRRYNSLHHFEFPSTVANLVIHAGDGECGCNCGDFTMVCGTPSGNTAWDIVTPNLGYLTNVPSFNATFMRRWSVKTVGQRWSGFNSALVQIPMATLMAGGVANGFHPLRLVPSPRSAPVTAWANSQFGNNTAGSWARQLGCPAYVARNPNNHYAGTAARLGPACGGPHFSQSQGNQRVDWWFRITL